MKLNNLNIIPSQWCALLVERRTALGLSDSLEWCEHTVDSLCCFRSPSTLPLDHVPQVQLQNRPHGHPAHTQAHCWEGNSGGRMSRDILWFPILKCLVGLPWKHLSHAALINHLEKKPHSSVSIQLDCYNGHDISEPWEIESVHPLVIKRDEHETALHLCSHNTRGKWNTVLTESVT